MVFTLLSITSVSAIDTLEPVQQGQCVQLPQTCATCTYNNISIVRGPNNGTFYLRGEYAMEKVGISYNYTFCNTTQLGTYFVDGHGNPNGVDTGWGGYTFTVNGSGQTVTDHQITLIIIGIVVMILVAAFFFVLSYIFKHPGPKIFFMAMSVLTFVVIIGVISSNANTYLAEFPGLVGIYDKYYILIMILSGTAMLGLIVWLIYYAFTLFSKLRGRHVDD